MRRRCHSTPLRLDLEVVHAFWRQERGARQFSVLAPDGDAVAMVHQRVQSTAATNAQA